MKAHRILAATYALCALAACKSPTTTLGAPVERPAKERTPALETIVLPISKESQEDAKLMLTDIEALPGGDLVVAGITDGATTLIPEATGKTSWWGFIARLKPSGEPIWVHSERQAHVSFEASDDTTYAGFLMEDGMLRPVGDAPERSGSAVIVRALDPSNGEVRWDTQRVLGGNPAMIWGLDFARQGDDIVMLAQISNVSLLGDTPLTRSSHIDTALSWYDAETGAHRRTDMISGPENTIAHGVAFAPDGDVVLVGTFHREVTIGDRTMSSAQAQCDAHPDDQCGMLARIGPDGATRWARGVKSSTQGAKLSHVAARGDGFVFAGEVYHAKELDLGLGPRTSSNNGQSTVFVAEVDAAGQTRWEAIAPTSETSLDVTSLRTRASGEVALGLFWNEVPNTTNDTPRIMTRARTLENEGGSDLALLGVKPDGTFRTLAHLDAAPRVATEGHLKLGHASALALTERDGALIVAGDIGGDVEDRGRALTAPPWSDGEGLRWGLVFQATPQEAP